MENNFKVFKEWKDVNWTFSIHWCETCWEVQEAPVVIEPVKLAKSWTWEVMLILAILISTSIAFFVKKRFA